MFLPSVAERVSLHRLLGAALAGEQMLSPARVAVRTPILPSALVRVSFASRAIVARVLPPSSWRCPRPASAGDGSVRFADRLGDPLPADPGVHNTQAPCNAGHLAP